MNVSAIAISATSILVIWSQPTRFNGILHDYKIRYNLSSDVAYGNFITAGNHLHYTVNDLNPFTDYELQVKDLGALCFYSYVIFALYIYPLMIDPKKIEFLCCLRVDEPS